MDVFPIKIWAKGNPGNVMMSYLAALKMQQVLGYGQVANVDIDIFDIHIPDIDTIGFVGLHDHMPTNVRNAGYVPARGIAHAVSASNATFIHLEGYCQNIENFPSRQEMDYGKIFPFLPSENGGGEDEIVINIRGGDILHAIHPDYCLIPPEFYHFVINESQKKPIFYGQLDDSPYMHELRQQFPNAQFVASRGAREDFDYLRKSKHLVPCLSTFSWIASWLSEARRIYLPVAGIINPFQHRSSMLLPFDDARYRFFKFPVYKALHVERYREYIDPIRGAWSEIKPEELRQIIPSRRREIDDYILALDPPWYANQNNSLKEVYAVFGNIGMYNHYMLDGFFSEIQCREIDESLYTRRYLKAAEDLTTGHFKSAFDHYARVGQHMGLLPT